MKLKKTYLIVSLLFVTLAAGLIKPAYVEACSCVAPQTIQQQLENKTAIFSGTVMSIVDPPMKKQMSSADPVTIVIDVKQVWKGEVYESTTIQTAVSEVSCGYEDFELGQDFLVFAYSNQEGELFTSLCEGNKKLSVASKELTALGEGKDPLLGQANYNGAVSPAKQLSDNTSLLWTMIVAIVLLAGILTIIVLKKRKT